MKQGPGRERVLAFADKFAALLTEADDLGIHWKTDDHRTYVALQYPNPEGDAWIDDIIIGWDGRTETWNVPRRDFTDRHADPSLLEP